MLENKIQLEKRDREPVALWRRRDHQDGGIQEGILPHERLLVHVQDDPVPVRWNPESVGPALLDCRYLYLKLHNQETRGKCVKLVQFRYQRFSCENV